MRSKIWLAGSLLVLGGCADAIDPVTTPNELPAFAEQGAASCADDPDFTVHNLAELHAALAAAAAGSVIAIDGVIDVPAGQAPVIATPAIRLTCATAGSGLRAHASGPAAALHVRASDAVVQGLMLDGRNSVQSAVTVGPRVLTDDPPMRVRISGNQMFCGGVCAFLVGSPHSVVSDNEMEGGSETTSGVHVQRAGGISEFPTDGTRVERNTIRIATASLAPIFGGIRVRDGRGLVVRDNTVIGPWANSIAAQNLEQSTFEHNVLEDAANFGMLLGFGPVLPRVVNEVTIRNNRIRGAGTAAVHLVEGCGSLLLGNLLHGSPDCVAFGARTGANTYVGNRNLVSDAGGFDCDGDGIDDPNAITGTGRHRTGPLGFAVREGVHQSTTLH